MPFLTVGYKRLHYADHPPTTGDPARPRETLLLHHGLGSSQNFYAPIVPALTGAGFRVVTFDATGAGRSAYTQVEQTVSTLAGDAAAVLDGLGVAKAVVAGHSMGGMVAAQLAADRPDRVVAAVLVGPVYPSPAVARVFEQRIAAVERAGMEPMADAIPAAATAKAASPVARAFIRELLLAQDKWGYISNCRVIANAVRPPYEKVEVPVLLLAGDEDKSAPLDMVKRIYDELGTTEKSLEVLPGVGHWHCIEAPDQVAAKIIDFYRQIQ
ncbi:putative alpha beta protein [Neofusicoccum parvum UCRNP2]|uniref:Putative alpha beta protein n=1 Tax=Botryosphaeria parva (strain UCR-NP2) TaxID=1287680 RepID=R1GLU4_BOTPV|nr:putative alpha beta protein [Neofusicoccum parvum UCRNP2]